MKVLKLTAMVAIAMATLTLSSCGGAGSSDSKFFGNVPGIYSEMTAKKEALQEKFKTCESQDEAMKLKADAEKAANEYETKLEEAGKTLDGKTIEIESTPEITVNSPITLTFDGFWSKSGLEPEFKMEGDVVVAQDYQSEESKKLSTGNPSRYVGMGQQVFLVGYDDAGTRVFSQKVGYFPMDLISENALGVKAGTPLKFETFQISEKNVEGCLKATSLKLSYESGK